MDIKYNYTAVNCWQIYQHTFCNFRENQFAKNRHGEVSKTKKRSFINKPSGCILITPESLESMFLNYGQQIYSIFSSLCYVVIDEIHAFMGTERGKQLQSLLHRLDVATVQNVPRIGLSATLGNMKLAADFIRPENPDKVDIIYSNFNKQELKVLTLGYKVEKQSEQILKISEIEKEEDDLSSSYEWVTGKLFSSLRGTNNLIFPNSRTAVEIYSDKLRKMCEERGVPNEFWPHHGSLSKEIREETELALKMKDKPASAICTNTLELGIDIGTVKSVAQIGPPTSVASLRQRLGRSGRKKGEPAILRTFCIENSIDNQSKLSDLLREQLVQTVAMIRLLIQGWCEPITNNGLHMSTLVQQLISAITQYGGLTASNAWYLFCEDGPFKNLTKQEFAIFIHALGKQEVINQDHTGLLILGPLGEKLVNHYSFYAAFKNDEEYRII
jgi:ATP-dependent Lhr-like helicase